MASAYSIYEIIQDTDISWGSPLADKHNAAEVEGSGWPGHVISVLTHS